MIFSASQLFFSLITSSKPTQIRGDVALLRLYIIAGYITLSGVIGKLRILLPVA